MADMLTRTHCLVKCKFKDSIMRAQNFQQYKAIGGHVCISLYSVILCTVLKIANLLLSRYGSGVVDDEYQCGSCGHGEPHGCSPKPA